MANLTRRKLLQYAGAGAAAVTMSELVSACRVSSSPSSSPSSDGKIIDTITVGSTSVVPNLDPYHALDIWSIAMGLVGLERLIQPSDTGALEPWLAESWSQPDELTYIFKIRPGVTFWDGSPLTMEDVVFSLARNLDPASQANYFFAQVKSFEVSGPNEVTAHMNSPMPVFLNGLAYAAIFPKKFVLAQGANFGTPAGKTQTVMGTGAFRVTSFTEGQGITATRYKNYWGPKPAMENIDVQFITDPQTLQLAFRSGAVDWTPGVPVDQAPQWQAIPTATVKFSAPLTSVFLGFNVNKPPFNDVHVRRAVAYCCDNAAMVRALLHGHGLPATTIVPAAQWGSAMTEEQALQAYAKLPSYPFSISKAKQELAQSSQRNGFTATILVPNVASYYTEAALAISQNLKQIGITLNVQTIPFTEYVTHYRLHDQLIYWLLSAPDYSNGADFPLAFYPKAGVVVNAYNEADYINPKVDALLNAWPSARTTAEQTNIMLDVLNIAQQDLPYVPLWWESVAMAIQNKYAYGGTFNALYIQQPWYNRISAK